MYRTGIQAKGVAITLACLAAGSVSALEPQDVAPGQTRSTSSILIEMVKAQDVKGVKEMLTSRADVGGAAEPDGTTAVHWAAHRGNVEMVAALLGAGAPADAPNRYGVRPLTLACEAGNSAVIELLLTAGADPNAATRGGEPPLMTAARAGSAKGVTVLIANGAAPEAAEPLRGQTALMWAAAEGNVDVIEALVAAGSNIHARSRGPIKAVSALDTYARPVRGPSRLDAFTPLLFAVQAGRISAVRALLAHGANVNDTAPDGTSALVLAIANAHYELASVLLDHGANPNLAGQGWNALVQVVRTKNPSIGQAPPLVPTGSVSPVELAKKIIAHGVEIDAPVTQQIRDRYRTHMDMVGATAYIMAAKAADAEMMRILLAAGANPHAKTKAGRTALMVAAGIDMWYVNEDSGTNEDAVEAVKVALEAGGDVNAANNDGETALHGAAFRGANDIVQMLVDRGASLDIKNKLGFTPLMVANGDQRISCNLQRRPWTVELLSKLMTDRGLPIEFRSDEEKFRDGVSRGYAASGAPPKC